MTVAIVLIAACWFVIGLALGLCAGVRWTLKQIDRRLKTVENDLP
jgi:hypothetical protein